MELKSYFAQDDAGNVIAGATCSVLEVGTSTLVTGLQTASGAPLTNPFLSTSNGLIQFAAPNGDYDLRVQQLPDTRDYRIRVRCIDLDLQIAAAEAQVDLAAAQVVLAAGQVSLATTQVGIATTQAGNAAASAALASAIALGVATGMPKIRPMLNLDFANAKMLDPRVTFARAGTGVYYDDRTTVKAEENLALYSQQFENAYWGKINSSISADATTAPDGTSTADKFIGNTTAGEHNINHAALTPVGTVATNSIYVKAGEITWILVHDVVANGCYFNIGTPAVGSAIGNATGGTITDVGGGWYRCSYTYTSTSASCGIGANLTTGDGVSSYTGANNTDGLYVWGAQCEHRSAVTAYTPTTTQPITNYIPKLLTAASGVPRFQHDPVTRESLGLLVEPAATNLQLYSEDLTNVTHYNTVECGLVACGSYGDTPFFEITETSANSYHAAHTGLAALSIGAGTYNFSATVRKKGRRYVGLIVNYNASNGAVVEFDLDTLTVVYSDFLGGVTALANAKITSTGYNLFRISADFTVTGTITSGGAFGLATFDAVVADPRVGYSPFVGDVAKGLFVTQLQITTGGLSSYTKTVASQVTRPADVPTMTGTNFSDWYNQGKGTFYAEYNCMGENGGNMVFTASDSDGSNRVALYSDAGGAGGLQTQFYVTRDGTNQCVLDHGTPSVGIARKIACGYSVDSFMSSLGGAAPVTDTGGVPPSTVHSMGIGSSIIGTLQLNGVIRKLAYYPTLLTSAEHQVLTA